MSGVTYDAGLPALDVVALAEQICDPATAYAEPGSQEEFQDVRRERRQVALRGFQ